MAQKQILGFATGDAPRNRKTKDSERFTLLEVNATFDGSGASGDFVPAVVILSDSGDVVGRFPTDAVVAAGDSAEVTFAPFLRPLSGYIRFNRVNTGGFLTVHTSGATTFQSGGTFTIFGIGGVQVDSFVLFNLVSHSTTQPMVLHSNGGMTLEDFDVANTIQVINGGTVGGVGGTLALIETFGGSAGHPHSVVLRMFDAKNVQVEDSQGNPLFRVDANGDLHGKTGKALVFDL